MAGRIVGGREGIGRGVTVPAERAQECVSAASESDGGVDSPFSLPNSVRVALLSDRWLRPGEWQQRGMALSRLGPTSLERLLADPPDVLVVEPSVCSQRQVQDCWQFHELLQVPVVVLAEGAGSEKVMGLLLRGADEVITGPPDGALLAAQVAAIVKRTRVRPAQRPDAVLRLGEVEIDLSSRSVRRPGSTQTLSRTEFELLEALLASRGRACRHAELTLRIWGAAEPAAVHYLRLYVRYLRQKIEQNPLCPRYLLNVRGIGYRLAIEPQAMAPADSGRQ